MKHDPKATAGAAAITTAVLFIVCRGAFVVVPELSMNIARTWFHGIDISLIAAENISSDNVVLGLVTATGGAWLVGYVFAKVYNLFAKKDK